MDTVTIELQSVGKRVGDTWILRDVTFGIKAGEALGVVGPSGSGKSTMLRLVAGLDAPSSGRILLSGRLASEPGRLIPPWERGIGIVFQQPTLWPHMTVEENIAFGLARWPRQEARSRVREVLALVKLTGLERRRPHQLSGGEAQRAALARAIVPRPRILLLDEPLSSLDPELHASMVELFLQVRRQYSPTVIYVSHNLQEISTVCELVLALRGGTVDRHAGTSRTQGRQPEQIPSSPAKARGQVGGYQVDASIPS